MAAKKNAPHLKASILFQDLSPAEQANLERRIPFTNIAAGTLIYSPDERGEVLFLLKEGRIRLYRLSPDGKALAPRLAQRTTHALQ